MKNQRFAGFILSYLSIFISSAIGLLFTPYMISTLGPIEYGLYQLIYAAIGYIALLDFGLGSTLTRFILKFKAEGNKEKENTAITMCVKIYCAFGAIAMIAVWIVSLNLDVLFKETINADNVDYARKLFLIMGATTSISLISHALTGVQTAHEKYIVTKSVYIFRQLSRVAIMMVLFLFNSGAMTVVITDFAVTVLLALFDLCYCKFKLKSPIIVGKWDKDLVKALITYSFFTFLQIIVTQTNNGLDRIILGRYSTLEIVALYGVAMQLYNLFCSIGGVVVGITLPKISRVVFAGSDVNKTTDCCVRYSRIQMHILAPLLGGFILLGKHFISLWTPGYDPAAVYIVALLIIVPQVLESIEGTIFNVMKAKNLQATRSLILLGVAVFNVVLTLFLIRVFPLYGAAMGTFISFVIGNNIISNIYYHKKVGVNIFRYFKNLFMGILPALAVSMLFGLAIIQIPLGGWLGFFAKGVLYVTVYGVCVLAFGLDGYEKQRVKALVSKIKR